MARQGLKFVGGADEGQSQALSQPLGNGVAKSLGGIEPRTHGGTADGQLIHLGEGMPQALEAEFQLGNVTTEFLAQRQGYGVLQVGTADLHDPRKRLTFLLE